MGSTKRVVGARSKELALACDVHGAIGFLPSPPDLGHHSKGLPVLSGLGVLLGVEDGSGGDDNQLDVSNWHGFALGL